MEKELHKGNMVEIVEINDFNHIEFDYDVICNRAIIRFENKELRLSRNSMEWLCNYYLKNFANQKDEYKEKYEELVKDYVRVTSNFVSLLANKK